jgi:guanylate kinase
MYKIIALMGEAGTGKDSLMQEILKLRPDFHEIISCTTRPMREGEVEGINYFYYTPEQFSLKVLNNEMLECTFFNNWFYGTSYESLRSDCINIGVFNPTGIASLIEHPEIELITIRVRASDKERLLRQLNRETNPNVYEIIRRFSADYEDFINVEDDFEYIEYWNDKGNDLISGAGELLSQIQL